MLLGMKKMKLLAALALATGLSFSACSGPALRAPLTIETQLAAQPRGQAQPEDDVLTVMTVNMAHGRADRFHQALLRKRTIKNNLERISRLLERVEPDVVAVQEADGPSAWSGRFDHVKWLAENAGYGWHMRGSHARMAGLDYGTGLLCRRAAREASSVAFARTPPTPRKGMVVATVEHHGVAIDVISVHLDFARKRARRAQVESIIALVKERNRPVIIAGDLNAEWVEGGAPKTLADALNLQAWQPREEMVTFPSFGKRLDWILVSPHLEILEQKVLPETVSDHRAVVAQLRLR